MNNLDTLPDAPQIITTNPHPEVIKRNSADEDSPSQDHKRQRTISHQTYPIDCPRLCHFCRDHPDGQLRHARRPCNWQVTETGFLECQNCADYRKQLRDDLEDIDVEPHCCKISRPGTAAPVVGRRIYASSDPVVPEVKACDTCILRGLAESCDVDEALDYGCSSCMDYPKRYRCKVRRELMGKRPTVSPGHMKWFRHACDNCSDRYRSARTSCSWLESRSNWGRRCTGCSDKNEICLESGCVVQPPPRPQEIPDTWEVAHKPTGRTVFAPDTLLTNGWRTSCTTCHASGRRCGVDTRLPTNACTRCAQLGIDCIGRDGTFYPIFDLSHVGFGLSTPFSNCSTCMIEDRNCDHQRPCDSCVKHGDKCDALGDKDLQSFSCCARFPSPPGPLYYLGMGYGPDGVDDEKTGTQLEHWVGPLKPIYGLIVGKDQRDALNHSIMDFRTGFTPEGVPPHGNGPESPMWDVKPSELTVPQLRALILTAWPRAIPPAVKTSYQERLKQLDNLFDIWGQFRLLYLPFKPPTRPASQSGPAATEGAPDTDQPLALAGFARRPLCPRSDFQFHVPLPENPTLQNAVPPPQLTTLVLQPAPAPPIGHGHQQQHQSDEPLASPGEDNEMEDQDENQFPELVRSQSQLCLKDITDEEEL